jgi:hypothetical protein
MPAVNRTREWNRLVRAGHRFAAIWLTRFIRPGTAEANRGRASWTLDRVMDQRRLFSPEVLGPERRGRSEVDDLRSWRIVPTRGRHSRTAVVGIGIGGGGAGSRTKRDEFAAGS